MSDLLCWAVLLVVIGILLLLWWIHVWAVMRDITKQDAEALADELYREYVRTTTYRVHVTQRITVDGAEPAQAISTPTFAHSETVAPEAPSRGREGLPVSAAMNKAVTAIAHCELPAKVVRYD